MSAPGSWTMIGHGPTWDGSWEYWRAPSGDVYRRRRSPDAYRAPDGSPVGARWEGGSEWFARFYVVERSAGRDVARVRPR